MKISEKKSYIIFKLKSTVWGQTCDGQDKLFDDFEMKILTTGDYLIWFNTGAYSTEGASYFNGFPIPKRFYTVGHLPLGI